ncbi:hypothetical protein BEP19_08665 [Ammoniphilus oxalaticus]|uniref:Uncharacterized protein n=1 Tax=Ammoniphilus oxalaticus TaxID=66863 RepID=A0A419SKH9_9BACL|nr:hypothetical protein [Ammoniphilus oxalaticus]RKD24449.1 hypothetical protein BEP19_08665 [Ammoniphilus oxalaticus]
MARSRILRRRDRKSIAQWIKKVKKNRLPKDKSERLKIMKHKLALPYEVMGEGSKRLVYDLTKKSVLKVAINEKGLRDNKREIKIYRSAPRNLKKHLAKIRENGAGWLIMDKINQIVPDTKKNKQKLKKLEKRFKKRGIITDDLFSRSKKLKGSNTRLNKKGGMVVIDYGNFKRKK